MTPHCDWVGAGALALLGWSMWATPEAPFPWPGAFVACVATTLLIVVAWSWPQGLISRLLSTRAMLWTGMTSYSLYLWHWGVTVYMRWTVGLDSLPEKAAALALTFALGAAGYYGVERAFRSTGPAMRWPSHDVFVRVGGMVAAVVALSLSSDLAKPRAGLAAANDARVWNAYSAPIEARPCAASAVREARGEGLLVTFPAPCTRKDAPTLYVIGDSHAGAYQRMLWRLAETGRWRVRLYTMNRCRLLTLDHVSLGPACAAFTNTTIADVARDGRRGDVIMLVGSHTPVIREPFKERVLPARAEPIPARIVAANGARIARLAGHGPRILIEDAKPVMPVALFRCADWFNSSRYCGAGASVPLGEMQARMAPAHAALKTLAASVPGAKLWSPAQALCRGKTCEGYLDGGPVYSDSNHLSAHGGEVLLPSLLTALEGSRERGTLAGR